MCVVCIVCVCVFVRGVRYGVCGVRGVRVCGCARVRVCLGHGVPRDPASVRQHVRLGLGVH